MIKNVATRLCIVLIIGLLSIQSIDLFAQDTTWVNTLNFDDITKRRGTFTFPDNPEEYRKILMYYTLKCDPRTAQDIFECGEWDYLAYTFIYKHLGVYDSSIVNAPSYNWGRGLPDTLRYTTEPTYTTNIKKFTNVVIGEVIEETEYVVGEGTSEVQFNNTPTRFQMLFSKSYLKDNEMSGKTFSRIKINSLNSGAVIKNLKVQLLLNTSKTLTEFEEGNFKTVYEGDYLIENEGWNYIDFSETFRTTSLQGFILQISYEGIENADSFTLLGDSFDDCVITEAHNKYLEFDGVYDYLLCDELTELSGKTQFTIEFWSRLHKWKGAGFYFNIPGVMDLRTVEEYRQPRRYKFTFRDDLGYGIVVAGNVDYTSTWNHIAVTYDGTKENYEDKVKFYFNGSRISGQYRGLFPNSIPDNKDLLLKIINENYTMNIDIDDFRVWSSELDVITIKDHMYNPVSNEHPNIDNLILNYTMDEFEEDKIKDVSGNMHDATLIGAPILRDIPIENIINKQQTATTSPNFVFCEGEYESSTEETFDTVKTFHSPRSLITYEQNGKATKVTNIEYVYTPGKFYTFDENGNAVDSIEFEATTIIPQDTIKYYSEPSEKLEKWEIARYITPYGLNLSLPSDGFSWVYDVTEYAPLLNGEVDIAAHNQQELIDLKFAFISGTPPRDVLRIDRPWGQYSSIRYRDLDNDSRLFETKIDLLPETRSTMIRARLTGHGHNSSNGEYPHCCEWKDNEHFIYADGNEISSFHIWRYYECGLNAVFPQGGTWPGQREGWCPGDLVYNYDFEISDFIKENSISVDYSITPVPIDNQGMGNGNYVTAMHLFEFGEANHQVDVEVYEVISPNKERYYSRMYPICAGPNVVVRNNGVDNLTSLNFTYSVSGGTEQTYNWTGNIPPFTKDSIELPIENSSIWVGDEQHIFSVTVSEPNGQQDEYSENDTYTTEFDMPDLYENDIVIWYQTNNEPQYYTYEIKDLEGNVVYTRNGQELNPGTLYKDEIDLPDGCYTLEFLSMRQTGLSYWAYGGQGSGYIRIYDKNNQPLKSFNPDFGVGILYSFDLGGVLDVQDNGYEHLMSVYPNPAIDEINIGLEFFQGQALLEIFDLNGNLILVKDIMLNSEYTKSFDISAFPNGSYFIRISNREFDIVKKFKIER